MTESQLLKRLTTKVTTGIEIGRLLHQVRGSRMYHPFTNWADYLADLGLSEHRAQPFIDAYKATLPDVTGGSPKTDNIQPSGSL
jgi:hypothetical protein